MSINAPTPDELSAILDAHAKWLRSEDGGSHAYLYGANLTGAYLSRANLSGAYLSGAHLSRANLSRANLYRANLTGANLTGANLYGANLTGAYLTRAHLYDANLSGANLYGANLYGANLARANLYGATGIQRERVCDLLMLLDQPGRIRAYKMVTADGDSPIHDKKVRYEVGKSYEEPSADPDPDELCGVGIHVATLTWILRNWSSGNRILIVEFEAADIACIPTATDGKFRLHRCTVVGEKDVTALVGGAK